MHSGFPFSFASPWLLALGLALAASGIVIGRIRNIGLPRESDLFALVALVMSALAAGGMSYRWRAPADVIVMVDLSPSTRSAGYRDRQQLEQRIEQLLGNTPHRIAFFADGEAAAPASGARLPDISCQRTRFLPPAASAIVLFSDAQFELPKAAPPIYVVVDAELERARDASVRHLELRGSQIAVAVNNTDANREFTLQPSGFISQIPVGSFWINRDTSADARTITASLKPGDAWPENDSLSINPIPSKSEKWWIGTNSPSGWKRMRPDQLPADATSYLLASTIVLENISADSLGPNAQQRLAQYVHDLGGSLVILGGDHAFAAGGYPASAMESVSPLASSPPKPAMHWMLLMDSSGSMAEAAGASTRWQLENKAVSQLVHELPPEDLVSIGSFSRDVHWWYQAKTVVETAKLAFPPASAGPGGPTNLQAALDSTAAHNPTSMESTLLLITDGQAQMDDPARLAALFKSQQIHLSVLAIGQGSALGALRQISQSTGGTVLEQADANQWMSAGHQLLRSASPKRLNRNPVAIDLAPQAPHLAIPSATTWNRTWLKPKATLLASATNQTETVPMIARWQYGAGVVFAAGMQSPPALGSALAELIARPARDPRFAITWTTDESVTVNVQAAVNKKYLNELPLVLQFIHQDGSASAPDEHALQQIAPGRYEISVPAPRVPVFAVLRLSENILDRIAIAGRYAPEFDAIGNNRRAMEELARHTGGQVIEPAQNAPIQFHLPIRDISLVTPLSAGAAVLLAGALAWWKIGLQRRRAIVITRDEA